MTQADPAFRRTPWNCQWSRLGYRLTGVGEDDQPEARWVCTRPTPARRRRSVAEAECVNCRHWEMVPTTPCRASLSLALRRRDPDGPAAAPPLASVGHEVMVAADHCAGPVMLMITGAALLGVGMALNLSIVLLPPGLLLMLVGIALMMWAAASRLYDDER